MRRCALPASPETLLLWVTDMLSEGKKVTTAERRAYGVIHYHRENGFKLSYTEEVKEVLTGVNASGANNRAR